MALNLFKKKKNHRQRRQLITHQQPKSPISEQYRNIRTNIEFAAVDKNLHSLMVTSANPSEGKTNDDSEYGSRVRPTRKESIIN